VADGSIGFVIAPEEAALRRHERVMLVLFAAFAVSVVAMSVLALNWDAWHLVRQPMEPGESRPLAGMLFLVGIFHVVMSFVLRAVVPKKLLQSQEVQRVAKLSLTVAIVALALCETSAVFGLLYVIKGGDSTLSAFFMSFALTAMVAHYAMRIRFVKRET
jgi:hypothetical protein